LGFPELARFVSETALLAALGGLLFVGGSFLLLIGINLFEYLSGKKLGRTVEVPPLADAELPHVLVQIPAFNEPEMVAGCLCSVAGLDWPQEKLHIQLLDDSTDETPVIAGAVVRRLRIEGFDITHLRRGTRSGYKAGALAAGLAQSHAPFVAMLDADFRPPAQWLKAVVPALIADPSAAFVQSRCEFSNYRTNWLTCAQGLMFDAHFAMEQATRARAGWLFQFNGTGGVWRRAAIEAAGGWLGYSLCEDLDLTIRAEIAGWHGIFAMDPAVPGLVPEKVAHWQVQQKRWSTGFVQVARKMVIEIGQADWSLWRKLSASFLILIQLFYPCVAVACAALLACVLLRDGDLTPYLPILAIIAALIAVIGVGLTLVPYMSLRRGPLWRYVLTLASLIPLMIFLSLSNAPSILRTMFGASGTWKRTPKTRPLLDGVPVSNRLNQAG